MADKIIIRMSVAIFDENGTELTEEKTETEYEGSYMLTDETHYIRYEEAAPDNSEIIINTVKSNIDGVRLSRKGCSHYTMELKKHERNDAKYVTPYGSFDMSNHMHEYILCEEEGRISIFMEYDLYMNNVFSDRRNVKMEILFK